MLDGNVIPADWAMRVAIPIFRGKEDMTNCGVNVGVKLLEHAMKIVDEVFEKSYDYR